MDKLRVERALNSHLLLDGSAETGFTYTVPPEQRPRSAFDEKAALAELERLQRAIEESRRQRKDAVARFDQFVASFQPPSPVADRVEVISPSSADVPSTAPGQNPALTRAFNREPTNLPPRDRPPSTSAAVIPIPPEPAFPAAMPKAAPSVSVTPVAAAAPAGPAIDAFPAERPSASSGPSPRVPEAFVVPDVPAAVVSGPRRARVPLILTAAGAVVAILAVVLLMRSSPAPDEPTSQLPPAETAGPTATPTPAPADAPAPVAPAASPAAGADVGGVHGELTTLRTAWVRVTIDGERAIERELPPNARIPLRAERSIVVRVGDAGAVRLTIDGRDLGPLGDEGEVVTRTFTARPSAGSGREPR